MIIRWIPGLVWLQLHVSCTIEPGHHWMYGGIVRRDTLTVRGRGLVVLAMPRRSA